MVISYNLLSDPSAKQVTLIDDRSWSCRYGDRACEAIELISKMASSDGHTGVKSTKLVRHFKGTQKGAMLLMIQAGLVSSRDFIASDVLFDFLR